jgi:hypothetical protein
MLPSLTEELTKQFYEWEQLGRGHLSFKDVVFLEPPFRPFFFHFAKEIENKDDGRTFSLRKAFLSLLSPMRTQSIKEEEPQSIIQPFIVEDEIELSSFEINLVEGVIISAEEMQRLLFMLSLFKSNITFEIIGSDKNIRLQFVVDAKLKDEIKQTIKSFISHIHIIDTTDSIFSIVPEDREVYAIDLALKHEFMRPLKCLKDFKFDPFQAIVSSISTLQENEDAFIQIVFTGVVNPWSESILRSVDDNTGHDFFMDDTNMLSLAKEKETSQLCAV